MRTTAVTILVVMLAAAGAVDAGTLFPEGRGSLRDHHDRQVELATKQVNHSLRSGWHNQVHRVLKALTTGEQFTPPQKPLEHQSGIRLLISEAAYRPATTITWRIKGAATTPSVVAEASSYDRFALGPHVADLLATRQVLSLQSHFATAVVHLQRYGETDYSAPSLHNSAAKEDLWQAVRHAAIAAQQASTLKDNIGGMSRVDFGDHGPGLMVHTTTLNGSRSFQVSDHEITVGLDAAFRLLSITTHQGAAELPAMTFNE